VIFLVYLVLFVLSCFFFVWLFFGVLFLIVVFFLDCWFFVFFIVCLFGSFCVFCLFFVVFGVHLSVFVVFGVANRLLAIPANYCTSQHAEAKIGVKSPFIAGTDKDILRASYL